MHRRLFPFLLLIYCLSLSAQQIGDAFQGVIIGVVPANAISLNGDWKFRFMEGQDWNKYKDFFRSDYNDQRWETIPVPGNWDVLGYTKPKYGNPKLSPVYIANGLPSPKIVRKAGVYVLMEYYAI